MPEKLTDRIVKALAAPAIGSATIWDSGIRGFGLRIFAATPRHPEGARSFFLNYRHDGTERRYTIGAFPAWSVEAAREEARLLRRRIDRGEDPTRAKRERRQAPTLRDLIERYKSEHMPTKFPGYPEVPEGLPGYRVKDEEKMLYEIDVSLGPDRKVADVHFGDCQKLHRDITESGRPVR